MTRRDAYKAASQRMSWPVTASTATTLAVFFPVIFWPGLVGQFMKYLPMTVIICLTASLFMALVFIPVLGGSFGGSKVIKQKTDEPRKLGAITQTYAKVLATLLKRYMLYSVMGRGVVFFPKTEPDNVQVQIHARGDLSISEKDNIVRQVEQKLYPMEELKSVYAKSLGSVVGEQGLAADVIGVIQIELTEWNTRRKARVILDDMAERTADIPGVILEFKEQEGGPASGKPINMEITSLKPTLTANKPPDTGPILRCLATP